MSKSVGNPDMHHLHVPKADWDEAGKACDAFGTNRSQVMREALSKIVSEWVAAGRPEPDGTCTGCGKSFPGGARALRAHQSRPSALPECRPTPTTTSVDQID
jgi:hypothetical protein